MLVKAYSWVSPMSDLLRGGFPQDFDLFEGFDLPALSTATAWRTSGRKEWLHAPTSDRTWQFVAPFQHVPVSEPRAQEAPTPARSERYRAALQTQPGLSRAEVARRFGVSRSAVTQALRRRV
jgi:hypothetical protein